MSPQVAGIDLTRRGPGVCVSQRALALAILVMLALGACNSSKGDGSRVGRLTPLGKRLPASVRSRMVLRVGAEMSYPPVDFFGQGTRRAQGLDPDLCQAMTRQLGAVRCQFRNTAFNEIIPALKSGRFDMAMSAINDNKERQKDVDFIDYFTAGTVMLAKKGGAPGANSLQDLCGVTLGLLTGKATDRHSRENIGSDRTNQDGLAEAQQARCRATGKPALLISAFESDADAYRKLNEGGIAGLLSDYPVAAHTVTTRQGLEIADDQLAAHPYGIAVRKTDYLFRGVIQQALQATFADGSYDRVLKKWNLTKGSLNAAQINGGADK